MDRIFIVVPPKPAPPSRPATSPYIPPRRNGMSPAEFLGCLAAIFVAGMLCMLFIVWLINANTPVAAFPSGPGLPPPVVSASGPGVYERVGGGDPVPRPNR
jgi:hypothetical protein